MKRNWANGSDQQYTKFVVMNLKEMKRLQSAGVLEDAGDNPLLRQPFPLLNPLHFQNRRHPDPISPRKSLLKNPGHLRIFRHSKAN